MIIHYKTEKLRKIVDDKNWLKRKYGEGVMNAVIRRISLIEAVPDLDALHHSVGRFEALESSVYEYSLRLDKGMRLVFSPYEPIPFKSDGGVDEKRVVEVLILKITNYH